MVNRRIGSKIFDIANYAILLFVIFVTLYPFWNSLIGSFNEGVDLGRGGVYVWPRAFTLENYQTVFLDSTIFRAYWITIVRTLVGTFLSLLVITMFSYAFSRRNLMGKTFYATLCIITMYFSGGMIPEYLIIKELGLIDNFMVYIFPKLFVFFFVLILTASFREVPDALVESAKIDGAREYTILFKIMIPLAKPALAAITLFIAVNHWNQFLDALLYMNKPDMQTMQLYLMKVIRSQEAAISMSENVFAGSEEAGAITGRSVQLAAMMIATIPILCLYPFLQKYFVKGMMIGSVKG